MATELTVTSSETVTPSIRRVWFRSDDLSAFAESGWTDRYVKLQFPDAVRTYTALFPDVDAGTLAIDFVTHGDEGVAGPVGAGRAARRPAPGQRPGRRLPARPDAPTGTCSSATSPRCPRSPPRSRRCRPTPSSRVVVARSRTPATSPRCRCRRGRAAVPPPRDAAAGARGSRAAVRALEWLPGRVHAFVHGEAEEVMHELRPYLLKERGLDRDQVSISGYWRRGRSEEGFREWKSELAEKAEAAR